MDIKFSKESQEADSSQDQPQEKGRQTSLLVLLLVLLGGFAYLYFFTDLIRKQPGEQLPLPAPSVVKQPLPQRPVSSVATVPSPTPPQVAVPAVPPTVAVVPAKPATAPAQQPAVVKPPVQPVVKPPAKQPSAAQMAAKVGGNKPVASQQAQPTVQTKTTAAPVKTKLEQGKAGAAKAPASTAAKQAAVKSIQSVKTAVAKPSGPWTVVVGLYVVEETLASDAAEVKKTGLNPLITTGPRREVTMNRLFLGEFSDKQQALQAIEKLRAAGGSGFTLQKGDKVEAYAGSFAVASGAQSERQRLAAAGVTTTVRKTTVSLASRKLTAGTYTNRSAADQAVKKLKSAGIGTPRLE